MPSPPSLNGLLVFAAVAEAGGFTAAGERLGMTKAGVSLQVKHLEARLGVALFARTTRQVHLTEAGRALYADSTSALLALREALNAAAARRSELAGTMRVAAPVDHAELIVAPVLAEFTNAHPGVAVDLRTSDRSADLVAEGIDVAIRLGELRDSSLRAFKLGEFEQHVVASPAYLRRAGHPEHPRDLAGHDWIAFGLLRTPLTWGFTASDGSKSSVRMKSRLQVDSSSSLRALLERGSGVSVLDHYSIADAVRAGRLVRLVADWHIPRGGIYAVLPPGKHVPALVRAFIDSYRSFVSRQRQQAVGPGDRTA